MSNGGNPVHYASDNLGGTYAQPPATAVYVQAAPSPAVVQSQPAPIYANGQPAPQYYAGGAQRDSIFDINDRPKPVGQWADNLCDWPKNIFPSCYCATFCLYGMYINAQMAQKTGYMTFRNVLWMTSGVYLISLIFQLIFGAALISYLPLFFALFFGIALRLHIVRRENITTNGEFLECCIGCWCMPCSVAQMARHLYGYTKTFDGDSDFDRRDNYAINV